MKANALLRVQPILTGLAACMCAGFAALHDDDATIPLPCFCGVVVGANILNDSFGDCEGQDGYATVRLMQTYPAVAPGEVSTARHNLHLGIGIDIELTMQRAVLGDPDDLTIDEQMHEDMVAQEILDMKVLYQAIGCCEALADTEVIVGSWLPIGPQGLTYGGQLPLYVLLD